MKNKKIGKKLVFILSIQPYSQDCIVVVNGQVSDAIKFIKKIKSKNAQTLLKHIEQNKEHYKDDREVGGGGAFLYTQLPCGYIMMVDHLNSWVNTVGLVVHEVTHLVHYVFRKVRIPLTEDSEEAYTYLTEKLVEDILEKIY